MEQDKTKQKYIDEISRLRNELGQTIAKKNTAEHKLMLIDRRIKQLKTMGIALLCFVGLVVIGQIMK